MKILFDNGVPVRLRNALPGHSITTAQERGWEELRNGELLNNAPNQFEVLMTTDASIRHQQRLSECDIALIVLRPSIPGLNRISRLSLKLKIR
jgi:predicted nuclease of predicted toxin-antitoxin system